MSLPNLPFEPPAIREYRRRVQKDYHAESLWSWLILRRVSIYISLGLRHIRFVTPNMITTAAIGLAITGMIVVSVAPDPTSAAIWAFVIYQVAYLLDVVDGELARLTDKTSRLGEWLDKILESTLIGLLLVTAITVGNQLGMSWALCVVAVIVFVRIGARTVRTASRLPTTDARTSSVALNIMSMLAGPPGFFLIILLGAVCDRMEVAWLASIALYGANTAFQVLVIGKRVAAEALVSSSPNSR